ncbi:MAG: hypothetical protein ABIR28_06160 [Vicinamibacteria bacterium]
MRPSYAKGDVAALLVLAIFPLLAYAEPLLEHRLLGPGDGVALHLPLRAEAFEAYRHGSLPFLNTKEFLGTPLLAAYRGGVLFPLTFLLAPFETFSAFQALVLISMSMAGVLTYFYLKRLGALGHGAFVGALCFAYGPYLLGHFEDTATLVAAPMLPLVMLAAESHMNRASAARLVGLGVAIALLIVAGSPEALRAGGALLFGRILLGHTLGRSPRTPPRLATGLAVLIGLALSAPQWLPTLALFPSAGRQLTGLASASSAEGVSGLAGLILKTVTHTPAASLALASLPLLLVRLPVRVLLIAVVASLALQTGRGPLLAPGALPLVLEFALASLAGLALDEQWRERRTRRGRTLRAYFLVASLASVAVLSIAAATLGGLPDRLAAAVGVYALALITYFALADAQSDVAAGVFLLPLAVSFALQPSSREVFKDAPTRGHLVDGTPTRRAVDMGLSELGPSPRVLTLVRSFPTDEALDLGFAGYGALTARVQANGYDPMAPLSVRRTLGEMSARGFLSPRSLTPDPELLRRWSIDAVQIPTADLVRPVAGEGFDLDLAPGARRFFALPFLRLKSVTITLTGPTDDAIKISVRVNGSREVVLDSKAATSGRIVVPTPSYRADAVIVERVAVPGGGSPRITGVEVETYDGSVVQASRLSAYLSDPSFQDLVTTPQIRVFRVINARSVVSGLAKVTLDSGPESSGRLALHSEGAQEVDIALPFFPGWKANAPLSEGSGRLRVTASAAVPIRLAYVPPLLTPGLWLALLGVGLSSVLLIRPKIVGGLLKTRPDEGK